MSETKRILLLCFIHGFKGNEDTFNDFPQHLEDTVANNLPDHKVASVVYPKYETKGALAQSTAEFLEWLKGRVIDLRKTHLENPWPPNDRRVGVVIVAHSMGGFVASDCLFRVLDERRNSESASEGPIFPLIQGILAFDTPYNGLARSMFVYGAFSNYQKVSNVFNVMTAFSAAAPATLSRLASRRATTSGITKRTSSSSPAWKAWQLVAVRTGAVGMIAAGGVVAYTHRRRILEGVRSVRTALARADVAQGCYYRQSVDALGQGLAYVNRGSVGASFAWLADHLTFVGALLRQNELGRRLERLAALEAKGGVGVCDVYASLGENGYWSGGYFVPERTFCAVPAGDQPAARLFTRHVVEGAKDEITAHVNLFKREKNSGYERMTNDAAQRIVGWFNDDTEIYDDPKFAEPAPAEPAESEALAKAVDSGDVAKAAEAEEIDTGTGTTLQQDTAMALGSDVPDESPIDIAAAAALVPLPDDIDQEISEDVGPDDQQPDQAEQKKAYLRHLLGIAQQTGTSLRSYLPSKLPTVEMPKVSLGAGLPSMPSVPSMPSISMPTRMNPFSKKQGTEPTAEEARPDAPGMELEGAVASADEKTSAGG